MSIIKNILSASMAIFFCACGSGTKPSKVADNFLTAVNKKDFKSARTYATPETGKLIDLMEQLEKISSATDSIVPVDFEIVSERIDKNDAYVTFKQKGGNESDELHLVKIEDKWLVDVSKQDLATKNTGQIEEGESGIFGDPNDTITVPDSMMIEQAF
jgi:hypothetical protein